MVRILIAVAVWKGFDIQLDVEGAFPHAKLPRSDDICTKLPSVQEIACATGKLKNFVKPLYSLLQARKRWCQHFAPAVSRVGCRRNKVSDCHFTRAKRHPVYLIMYVDDPLVIGPKNEVEEVKTLLSSLCTITDLENLTLVLAIKLDCVQNGVFVSQRSFAEKIITPAGWRVRNPFDHLCLFLISYVGSLLLFQMKAKVMWLMFRTEDSWENFVFLCTRTQPDLSNAISMLGKY